MNKVLQNDSKLEKVKNKLFKYVSIRKEKSQNFKKGIQYDPEDDMDDDKK